MRTLRQDLSGQALLEMALILPMLVIFVLGVVDYSRAIYDREVITNLAGEGSSSASRSGGPTAFPSVVSTVVSDASGDLNMSGLGCVIISSVTVNTPGGSSAILTGQATSSPCTITGSSKIGCYPAGSGCSSVAATVPAGVQTVLTANANAVIYVTEVFYKYQAITPIGHYLNSSAMLPSQLYSVAYY